MTRERQPRPKYEIDVDRDLNHYTDAQAALEHQKAKLVKLAFEDLKFMQRLTSSYDLIESQRGNPRPAVETTMEEAGRIEAIIAVNRNYIDSIDDSLFIAFGGQTNCQECMEFIRLYWWTFPRTSIRARKDVVIAHMPWLRDQHSGRKPFYDFRKKIYIRLAQVWGYSTGEPELKAVAER